MPLLAQGQKSEVLMEPASYQRKDSFLSKKGYHRTRIFASGERVKMVTFNDIQKANEAMSTITLERKDKKTGKTVSKEYAEVNQRIKAFRMVYPEGTIETEMLSNSDGVVIFKATAKNIDIILGTGHAYEKESSSFINQTSYIENAETSAIGRCLASCGFGIDTSVASYEEVANAIKNQETIPPKGPVMPKKASEDSVRYILTNATETELKKVVEAYKINQLSELSEDQAQKTIRAINKRKAESGNVI